MIAPADLSFVLSALIAAFGISHKGVSFLDSIPIHTS